MQFSLDWVTKAVTLPWYIVEEEKNIDESWKVLMKAQILFHLVIHLWLFFFFATWSVSSPLPTQIKESRGWKTVNVFSLHCMKDKELRTLEKKFFS